MKAVKLVVLLAGVGAVCTALPVAIIPHALILGAIALSKSTDK